MREHFSLEIFLSAHLSSRIFQINAAKKRQWRLAFRMRKVAGPFISRCRNHEVLSHRDCSGDKSCPSFRHALAPVQGLLHMRIITCSPGRKFKSCVIPDRTTLRILFFMRMCYDPATLIGLIRYCFETTD